MMSEIKYIGQKQIFLFDEISQMSNANNSLKEFIYYLKFSGKRGMINFAFSSANENIHQHMSIKDNYILDSVPTSLIKDREDNFSQRIDGLKNKFLKELVVHTNDINRIVNDLSSQEKKLVSIVKALLSDSEYIFLDKPDCEQPIALVNKIKDAILYEVEKNQRKVFLISSKREVWLDITTDIITRNQNKEFIKSSNKLNKATHPKSNLSLIKKAS
jgi:ABC-type sugar transport system ATPase subunit